MASTEGNQTSAALFDLWANGDADSLFKYLKSIQSDDLTIRINDLHPESGRALLHLACSKGHKKLVQLICERFTDVDVNIREKFNRVTPLMYAAREGHDHVIEFLVSACEDLDINAQDRDGYTALHYACINKHVHTVEVLSSEIERCDVNIPDSRNRTPLHRAVECMQVALVRVLLQRADIELSPQDHLGWTPLHYASYNQMRNACSMLIERGANVEVKDSQCRKPLFYGYGFFEEEEGGCSCPKHTTR